MADLSSFWELVDQSNGPDACWPWQGPIRNAAGYGAFAEGGRQHVATRWLLGALRGSELQWPSELALHKCDNKRCCNPRHLYIGTHSDNTYDAIARLNHGSKLNSDKTHCVHGHEFTQENTHWFGPRKSMRYCKECKRAASRESARKRRANANA